MATLADELRDPILWRDVSQLVKTVAAAVVAWTIADRALDARLGGPVRDELTWAVDDAVARGLVHSTAGADSGPPRICGTSAPAVFTLTPAGRAAAR